MKTILIKTQKRKNNISKEYLQADIQKRLFLNELSNKILLIHIDLENIELLINDKDLNLLVNKILEYKLNDNFYIKSIFSNSSLFKISFLFLKNLLYFWQLNKNNN